jgi:uncharacterized protein with PIN domain
MPTAKCPKCGKEYWATGGYVRCPRTKCREAK